MPATSAPTVNFWPYAKCARAFWSQQEVPSYRRLLKDTLAWLDPKPGEHWLDLGCGSGQLTAALWTKSEGTLARVTASDCAAVNEQALQKLRRTVQPSASEEQIPFVRLDFSDGLPLWNDETFDGVVSGLAIQYAECYSLERSCWTTEAYDRLLAEVCRVLRPGGRFVFSVNVPEPAWGWVALRSLHGILQTRQPARYVRNCMRMLRYGAWLTRESRRGRFHYLPIDVIVHKLAQSGFGAISHRLSYARQAYLIRCIKPAN